MKRERRGRARNPSIFSLAEQYLTSEFMLLLFETPSGFAVFHFCGSLINRRNSLEDLWSNFTDGWKAKLTVMLKEFQTFEDKSSAINQNTGVNERLTAMIRKWLRQGQKMAVGKPEYKAVIEERLKIDCLYNPAVMEVMWGIQNCMPSLVPGEKSQLAEEDRLPMSKGLQEVLKRHGFNVKPEMVNKQIIAAAVALFACDSAEKDHSTSLIRAAALMKGVSGISCEDWSLLEIAKALKMIWQPEEAGSSCVVSKDEAIRLARDAHRYEVFMNKHACLRVWDEMVEAHDVKTSKEELLKSLVKRGPWKHMKRRA